MWSSPKSWKMNDDSTRGPNWLGILAANARGSECDSTDMNESDAWRASVRYAEGRSALGVASSGPIAEWH